MIRLVVAAGYEDYLQNKFPNYYTRRKISSRSPALPTSMRPPRSSSVNLRC